MEPQNYANHRRFMPSFHFVLFPVVLLTVIGAAINLWKSIGDHSRLYNAALVLVLAVCVLALFFFARVFALKAQDRAIRAEENLRHYVLTGRLLDPRLHTQQVVGLRFASDAEFPGLAEEAAENGLTNEQIKKKILGWRGDHYRV